MDFSQAVDMRELPDGSLFTVARKSTHPTPEKSALICEMEDEKPWSYHIDLYGLAEIIFYMIFGFPMEPKRGMEGWSIGIELPPRLQHKKLWNRLFAKILNVDTHWSTEFPKFPTKRMLIDVDNKLSDVLEKNEDEAKKAIGEFTGRMKSLGPQS